jgi:hypothetical protein
MNASSAAHSQKKIDLIVLFFDLTSVAGYGCRRAPMIFWFLLPR